MGLNLRETRKDITIKNLFVPLIFILTFPSFYVQFPSIYCEVSLFFAIAVIIVCEIEKRRQNKKKSKRN